MEIVDNRQKEKITTLGKLQERDTFEVNGEIYQVVYQNSPNLKDDFAVQDDNPTSVFVYDLIAAKMSLMTVDTKVKIVNCTLNIYP